MAYLSYFYFICKNSILSAVFKNGLRYTVPKLYRDNISGVLSARSMTFFPSSDEVK